MFGWCCTAPRWWRTCTDAAEFIEALERIRALREISGYHAGRTLSELPSAVAAQGGGPRAQRLDCILIRCSALAHAELS